MKDISSELMAEAMGWDWLFSTDDLMLAQIS